MEKEKKLQEEAVQETAVPQAAAPGYQTNQELADAIANGTLTGKGVTDAYGKMAAGKLDEINAMGSFKYDFNKDPMFKILSNSYMEQARQAANNTNAMAAARTGGYGNSYGAAAAGQQYNAALGNLYDQVPELQDAAYQKYLNERNDLYKQAEYYTDRGDTAWTQNFQQTEADRDQDRWQKEFDFNADWTQKNWDYNLANDAYNRKVSAAQYLASLGAYGAAEALYGVDLSDAKTADALNRALAIIQATGLTGYEATAFIQQYVGGDLGDAINYGYSGGGSGGGSGTGTGSGTGSGKGTGSGSGSYGYDEDSGTITVNTIPVTDQFYDEFFKYYK